MWQMKPGSGLEPASPRETDYRYGAPTTRLWPGPIQIPLSNISIQTGRKVYAGTYQLQRGGIEFHCPVSVDSMHLIRINI